MYSAWGRGLPPPMRAMRRRRGTGRDEPTEHAVERCGRGAHEQDRPRPILPVVIVVFVASSLPHSAELTPHMPPRPRWQAYPAVHRPPSRPPSRPHATVREEHTQRDERHTRFAGGGRTNHQGDFLGKGVAQRRLL